MTLRNSEIFGVKPFPGEVVAAAWRIIPVHPPFLSANEVFYRHLGQESKPTPTRIFLDEIFDHDMGQWPPVTPWNFNSSSPLKMLQSQKERLVFRLPTIAILFSIANCYTSGVFLHGMILQVPPFPPQTPNLFQKLGQLLRQILSCFAQTSGVLRSKNRRAPWTRSAMDESGQNY